MVRNLNATHRISVEFSVQPGIFGVAHTHTTITLHSSPLDLLGRTVYIALLIIVQINYHSMSDFIYYFCAAPNFGFPSLCTSVAFGTYRHKVVCPVDSLFIHLPRPSRAKTTTHSSIDLFFALATEHLSSQTHFFARLLRYCESCPLLATSIHFVCYHFKLTLLDSIW